MSKLIPNMFEAAAATTRIGLLVPSSNAVMEVESTDRYPPTSRYTPVISIARARPSMRRRWRRPAGMRHKLRYR